MEGVKVSMQSVILNSDVQFCYARNKSKECIFTVRKGADVYRIVCFDDERRTAPYKRIVNMKLKRGSCLNIECEMTLFTKKLIPDNEWAKLSSEENPTLIRLPQFKLLDVDFAIPVEYYKSRDKEGPESSEIKERQIVPMNDLSKYGGV